MKRPYREGDWFAVPLGAGRYAAGIVTHGTRKLLDGYFFAPARAGIPNAGELAGLRAGEAVWSGRFSDRALVAHRWPRIGAQPRFSHAEWPRPNGDVFEAHVVERIVAAAAVGGEHVRRRLCVGDLRSPVDPRRLESLPPDARVQWRAPLADADLDRVMEWIERHPDATLRAYGKACGEIGVPAVRQGSWYLALEGVPENLRSLFERLPGLRALRVAAGGSGVEAAVLATLPSLRALDLSHAVVDDLDAVMRLDNLRALRLYEIPGLRSIDALRGHPNLRALALHRPIDCSDFRALATLPHLESLELAGAWQLELEDVAFLQEMRALRFLRIDIGGRRKNVEVYKRLPYALPLPFDPLDQDFKMRYECGVQSTPAYLSSVTTSGADSGFSGENGGE